MGTMKFWDMAGRFNICEKLVVPVDGTIEFIWRRCWDGRANHQL